jgi:hypothetical protein
MLFVSELKHDAVQLPGQATTGDVLSVSQMHTSFKQERSFHHNLGKRERRRRGKGNIVNPHNTDSSHA